MQIGFSMTDKVRDDKHRASSNSLSWRLTLHDKAPNTVKIECCSKKKKKKENMLETNFYFKVVFQWLCLPL